MKIKTKVFVVTGGGSGMGRELVLALLANGARVAAIDLDERSLAETMRLAGDETHALVTAVIDITDREAVLGLPDQVIARFGCVDGIINNAGIIQPFLTVNALGFPAIERVLHVNLFGTINMVKAFLPHLLDRPEAHITNISSMGGFVPVPGQVVYGASKAAVKLLTEGLASELAGTRVRAMVVFPGAVKTNITANSSVKRLERPAGRQSSIRVIAPDVAARIVVEGIEKDRPRVLVGSDAKIMDLISRLNPIGAARMIQRKMGGLFAK